MNLKLCSKQYNRIDWLYLIVAPQQVVAGDIATQPKQGRQAAPMSSLCILLCLWSSCKVLLSDMQTLKNYACQQCCLLHGTYDAHCMLHTTSNKYFLMNLPNFLWVYYTSTVFGVSLLFYRFYQIGHRNIKSTLGNLKLETFLITGASVIKLFTMVMYCHSMVLLSFCIVNTKLPW